MPVSCIVKWFFIIVSPVQAIPLAETGGRWREETRVGIRLDLDLFKVLPSFSEMVQATGELVLDIFLSLFCWCCSLFEYAYVNSLTTLTICNRHPIYICKVLG